MAILKAITLEVTFLFRSVRDSIARGKEIIAQDLREKGSSSFSGLMCWSCTAENMEQCVEKGEVEICDHSEVRSNGILFVLVFGLPRKHFSIMLYNAIINLITSNGRYIISTYGRF